MKIGMMGAGVMARRMTETWQKMDDMEMYALAARTPEKCIPFVEEMGWQKYYQTYEELVSDPEVELVYIPTPTYCHFELTKLAIDHGKPVLCEKPLCVNENQTKELLDYAKEKGVFLAEGLWTDYMPMKKIVDEIFESGVLGELKEAEIVNKNNVIHEPRYASLEMAAGALMDVGSYSVGCSMVSHFGADCELIESSFKYLPNGLDEMDDMLFEYPGGLKVHVVNNVHSEDEYVKSAWYKGTNGSLFVDGTSNPKGLKLFDKDGKLIKEVKAPEQISGFEYEWRACKKAIEKGLLEPDEVPHETVLGFIHVADYIRAKMGLKFPFEE